MRGADVSIWCSAALLAAALGGCSLVFPFDEGKLTGSGGAGGEGGAGGAGAGTTSSSTTGTSSATTSSGTSSTSSTTTSSSGTGGTGGTVSGPVVACNYPMVSDCQPGEICCLDLTSPYVDVCAPRGLCGSPSEYGELTCENSDDCSDGLVCCGHFIGGLNIVGSYCDTSCDLGDGEVASCTTDVDCELSGYCDEMVGSSYPSYTFCNPD
jgi:hypothetical protein